MKIQLISDTHVEFSKYKSFKLHDDAEVLVIAGDASNFEKFPIIRKMLKEVKIPILFVFGNHEFYPDSRALANKFTMTEIKDKIRDEMKDNPYFHILDNKTFQIGDVNFIGSILWSNLEFNDCPTMPTLEVKKSKVGYGIMDFHVVKDFNVDKMMEMNRESKEFIFSSVNPQMKNVVITHFAPSSKCVAPQYARHILNCYFVNDIPDEKFKGIDGWLFGHTHSSMQFEIEGCKLCCNPRGYVTHYRIENEEFDDTMLVEI